MPVGRGFALHGQVRLWVKNALERENAESMGKGALSCVRNSLDSREKNQKEEDLPKGIFLR